MAGPGFEPG